MSIEQRTQLTNWYREVLKLADCHVAEQGHIYFGPPGFKEGTSVKLKMDDGVRQLVLPIPSILSKYDPAAMVGFHPIHEVVDSSESPVLLAFRKYLNTSLNLRIGRLVIELMRIAESPALQRNLSSSQAELTKVMHDIPSGTTERLANIMMPRWVKESADALWVHLSLRKNGTLNGKKRTRISTVHYPLVQQIDRIRKALDEGRNIKDAIKETWFIKADQEYIESVYNLIDFLFPERDVGGGYSSWSDSHQAPMLEALLKGATSIGTRVNEIVEQYRNVLTDPDSCMIDLSFRAIASFEDVESWAHSLSPLRGNGNQTQNPVPPPVSTAPSNQPPAPPPPPQYNTAPAPVAPPPPPPQQQSTAGQTKTFAELRAQGNPYGAPPPAPYPYPQPQGQPYQAPVPLAPMPGQPAAQPAPGCRWAQDTAGNWVMVDQWNRIVGAQAPMAGTALQSPPGSALAAAAAAEAPRVMPNTGYPHQPQPYPYHQPPQGHPYPPAPQPNQPLYRSTDQAGRPCLVDANGYIVSYT